MSLIDACAKILDKAIAKKASLKTLIYSEIKLDKKQAYALINNVLKFRPILEEIIEKADFLTQEKHLTKNHAILIAYQLLFFKGATPWGRQKTRLRAELARIKIKKKVTRNQDLMPEEHRDQIVIPRYIRVNLAKMSVEQVIAAFKKTGFTLEEANLDVSCIKPKTIRRDIHLEDLLILSAKTDLHDRIYHFLTFSDPLYLDGSLILQDKASCLPAYILNPPANSTCLDACAAPGNKTTHLASIMKGAGKIYALDADPRRLETLKNNSKRQGFQECIEPLLADFLKLDVGKYSDVEYILLDPSCSGSGIVGRLDNLLPDAEQQPVEGETSKTGDEYATRITALAKFQLDALNHAMSFPNVKKVVYSTCSIHNEENELVVAKALDVNEEWRLEREVLPSWKRRGVSGICGDGSEMLRCSPAEGDYTIGFFAALFVKK